jgi:HEAT repeat protein
VSNHDSNGKSPIPELLEALRHADDGIRESAARALRRMGKEVLQISLENLHSDDPVKRSNAAWELGMIGLAAAVPDLLTALHNSDDNVRCNIVWALGNIGDGTAVHDLIEVLPDSNADVRQAIAYALGRIGENDALHSLTQLLREDESWRVRLAAAKTLGQL